MGSKLNGLSGRVSFLRKFKKVLMNKFDISAELQNKPSDHAKGSDVCVLIKSHAISGAKKSTVLDLLDSGASNYFISK